MFFVQQPALMTLNKLLNYKQKYNIMNKIITLSIATIFLATSYASYSQNIEHQSPHHKTHWGTKERQVQVIGKIWMKNFPCVAKVKCKHPLILLLQMT